MRNPILHVSKSDLEIVFSFLDIPRDRVMAVFLEVTRRKMQLKSYYQLPKTNAKVRSKTKKTVEVDSSAVELFNNVLNTLRKEAKHKFSMAPLSHGTINYQQIMEASSMAKEYAETFGIRNMTEAFNQYIKLALDLMGKKYQLSKFKYYNDKIYAYTEAIQAVQNDPSPEKTDEFIIEWKKMLAKYAGIVDYSIADLDLIHYLEAKNEAIKAKATFSLWLEAQFEGLAFMNVIPEPYQLYGDNAIKRYNSYRVGKKASDKPKITSESNIHQNYAALIAARNRPKA